MLTQDELNALKSVFDIHPAGNFEGHIVLQRGRADSLAETVQVALDKLFQRRYGNNPSTSFLATTGAEARGSSWPGHPTGYRHQNYRGLECLNDFRVS